MCSFGLYPPNQKGFPTPLINFLGLLHFSGLHYQNFHSCDVMCTDYHYPSMLYSIYQSLRLAPRYPASTPVINKFTQNMDIQVCPCHCLPCFDYLHITDFTVYSFNAICNPLSKILILDHLGNGNKARKRVQYSQTCSVLRRLQLNSQG